MKNKTKSRIFHYFEFLSHFSVFKKTLRIETDTCVIKKKKETYMVDNAFYVNKSHHFFLG